MKKSFFAFETAVFTVISAVFTMSAKHKANRLVLQEDGNLVAYSSEGIPVWWTNTNGAFSEGVFNIS